MTKGPQLSRLWHEALPGALGAGALPPLFAPACTGTVSR